ncbi:MAG: transglutaminase family protein [Leptospiraceae bacterium]|nr:transglutaminase family protein [Leptospiraceae bacterium]MCP5499021.1 transglutaminase family protein [Leptospiraceae bacterium]
MPRFIVTHTTIYEYEYEAMESYSKVILSPLETFCQGINSTELEIRPSVPFYSHRDYFGNLNYEFSVPFRHKHLEITSRSDVITYPPSLEPLKSNMKIKEARQWFKENDLLFYDYLKPSYFVKTNGKVVHKFAERFLPDDKPIGEAILELNRSFTKEFKYKSGSTTINTPVEEVLEKKQGVCQDFAHSMISILRTAGIAARYVSGYIESYNPNSANNLTGSEQSHAWLDVYLPERSWMGMDPTNNMASSEQHIRVAVGRDFYDVSPVKGTFKGAGKQFLKVDVKVRRAETVNQKIQNLNQRE